MLGIEPRAFCVLGKCSTIEPNPSPERLYTAFLYATYCASSWVKCLIISFAHFSVELFIFFLSSQCPFNFWISFDQVCFLPTSFPLLGLPSHTLYIIFCSTKAYTLLNSIFSIYDWRLWMWHL